MPFPDICFSILVFKLYFFNTCIFDSMNTSAKFLVLPELCGFLLLAQLISLKTHEYWAKASPQQENDLEVVVKHNRNTIVSYSCSWMFIYLFSPPFCLNLLMIFLHHPSLHSQRIVQCHLVSESWRLFKDPLLRPNPALRDDNVAKAVCCCRNGEWAKDKRGRRHGIHQTVCLCKSVCVCVSSCECVCTF